MIKAIVLRFFIDKITHIPYDEGRVIELNEERFQELSDKSIVDFAPEEDTKQKKKKKQ